MKTRSAFWAVDLAAPTLAPAIPLRPSRPDLRTLASPPTNARKLDLQGIGPVDVAIAAAIATLDKMTFGQESAQPKPKYPNAFVQLHG